ncbi:MAG: protein-L-isoaspartate O-methyltransferase, partial [Rhodospirillaceae bacterium]|nr:protein-L-isoaspartate O-methyltransferase [Rhodospirillaceae bacterium]
MNVEAACTRMLGQQLRAWNVLDQRVLDVVRTVGRERFAPEAYRELAFADTEIPLAHGQRMMTPSVEGRLLQALDLDPADTVLEVGTGSGFLTACLAALAGRVVSVDIFAEFTADAAGKLRRDGVHNVELRTADALALDRDERFDAIAVTGSMPALDDTFDRLLRPGGRLFVVVGRAPVMDALLIRKDLHGNRARDILFE